MEQQYLTIWDLVLTPLYLVVLIFFARRFRDKRYPPGHPLRPYFLSGLLVKFGGVLFIALVYQYYYSGGDTYNFFVQSKILNSALDESFTTWVKLIFHFSPEKSPEIYAYSSQLYWYDAPSEHVVVVITALFGLFCFNSYLPIGFLFAFFSFTGIWALYRQFTALYPQQVKPLAFAILFIPSTVVWGSSVFKDTICMFGLGWMTYTTFRIVVNRDLSIGNFLLLALSFYLIAIVKVYIILAFLPALGLWLIMTYTKRIQNRTKQRLSTLFFLAVISATMLVAAQRFSAELNRYSLDKLSSTLEATRGWITYASGDEGSTYNIGEMDGSLGSILAKFPAGVVVTLFRPFLWEARKVVVVFSALEALAFLVLTLKVIFKRTAALRSNLKDPTILFCLIFTLVFAFSVGVSSGNFGALSRYKIPCLPFYGVFLVTSLYSGKRERPSIAQVKREKNTASFA